MPRRQQIRELGTLVQTAREQKTDQKKLVKTVKEIFRIKKEQIEQEANTKEKRRLLTKQMWNSIVNTKLKPVSALSIGYNLQQINRRKTQNPQKRGIITDLVTKAHAGNNVALEKLLRIKGQQIDKYVLRTEFTRQQIVEAYIDQIKNSNLKNPHVRASVAVTISYLRKKRSG